MEDFTLTSSATLPPTEEETIPEFLLKRTRELAEMGKEDWIIDVLTGESHNYKDFEDETRRVASFFYKHGMRKGDTIIYMTYDLVKIHILFTGVWRANGTVRASYPEDDEETLLSRVEESRVGWILCDPEAVDMCKSVADKVYWDVEVMVNGEAEGCISYSEILEDDGSEMPELTVTGDHPALIFCTSGTTGRSKGAVHSHRGLIKTLLAMGLYGPFLEESPNLIVSKSTHITGALFPLSTLCVGKTVLVLSVINKLNLFQAVHNHKPGFVWGFPTFLLLMVNDPEAAEYDFSSLVRAGSGGAQITPTMEKTLMELPNLESFLNLYGLTEVCPVSMVLDCSTVPPTKFEDVPPFSVGKVPVGTSIQMRDPDTGEVLGPNQKGEICVKTESIFACYLNNPEATENAFVDGYFRTGDLGYYDENGFIFLVDRMKEIFKYFNNHISPTELEDVINQHGAVNEVCVFGIDDPAGGGSIPRAVVTIKNEHEDATAEEILEFANAKLPDYKRIRGGVFIIAEMPKGKTGKVTRNLAAQLSLPEPE